MSKADLAKSPKLGVLLFGVSVLCVSTFAGLYIDTNDSPWALLFVMSPLLVSTILRLTRDGWADAGLRLSGSWYWYAAAVLVFPVLGACALTLGWVAGAVQFHDQAASNFLSKFVGLLLPCTLFAMGEEWGWRGYLEPRLSALGLSPNLRHLGVGVLWAVWHVPHILALGPSYTPLPLHVQLPLFHVAVIAMAFLWGFLRARTGSVWPAVLGHGVANALAFPLLDANVVHISNPLVFAARPEGLVMLTGFIGIAFFVALRGDASDAARPANGSRPRAASGDDPRRQK